MEEKTCSVQNGRCTCNQGLHPDGTVNCVGKFTHYHLSGQFHVSSGILVLSQQMGKSFPVSVLTFK